MDEFLRQINSYVFLHYIANNHQKGITFTLNGDQIDIDSDHSTGRITLYQGVIFEMEVIDKKSEEAIFYIHFMMANMKHAVSLYHEMLDAIYENCSQPLGKILLCCSGGLTTSYFASKMAELAKLENLNYEIEATGFAMLYEIGKDADIVLLAPQVSYLLPDAKYKLGNDKVEAIPTKYFARNDYKSALEFALNLLEGVEGK